MVHDGAARPADIEPDARIVVVVRDPATNASHPNVVSVPTRRVPQQYAGALLPKHHTTAVGDTRVAVWQCRDSHLHDKRDPVVHEVVSLLSQKLGLADTLESGEVRFQADVVAVRTGRAAPESMQLTMITVLVGITRGADLIPSQTASYSDIRWVPAARFVDAVARRDPSAIGLSPVDFCIHGLCIASTYDVLASALGHAPYCV